jgi:hypothetical protein
MTRSTDGNSIRRWFVRLKQADKLVFELDRPAWEQAYARVNSAVVRTMLPSSEEGEDDGSVLPTERWQALHDLLEAKEAAEKTALPPTLEEQKKTAAMLYLAGIPASPSEPRNHTRAPS